jgi:pyruvate dehydrogenase E2 component (dihydrolipoamide acetyltransferase)
MPSLGADMESGVLVQWLVQAGQPVRRGQVVAVVETQKGAVEVEIWEDGVIERLVTQPGTRVPVGEVLATLAGAGAAPAAAPAAVVAPAAAPAVAAPPPAPTPRPPPPAEIRVKASPAARKRAEELGLDLSAVRPSGPHGIIAIEDVERAAQARAQPAAPVARPPAPSAERLAAMRQAIAAAMAKSKREIPHYYLGTSIDVSRARDWLTAENLKRPVKERILFAAVLSRATAAALKEVPELNGFWIDGRFQPSDAVHLGVGIALRGGGLIAPAIHDADKKSIPETMAALADLVQRTRAGSVRSSELTDATVTVTNLGELGIETVYGVIYPPQVALVGFGRIAERPWAENGGLYVRPVLHATLSADHRASVGHRGALFLAALDRLLQEPEKL